jgi:nitrite reductase/ring-hydroxylating ferredoxin subunit
MEEFVKVAQKEQIPLGTGIAVEVGGMPVAVFNLGGRFCATHNTCLHKQGPLGEGTLEENVVTCPWHGWQYNVETGECLTSPGRRVATLEVKVEGNDILVQV